MKDIDDTAGTAAYLSKAPHTLQQWRYQGYGPPYIKLGASAQAPVRYRRVDVDQWLEGQVVRVDVDQWLEGQVVQPGT